MAVVVGEAAVRIRPDVDEGEFRSEVSGPIGDSLEEAGGSGAAKFTAAFGAALAIGGAFSVALENAALGDKLSAQLGASGEYAEDLGAIAGDLYANAYGDSLGSVNDALRSVIQSGAVMEDASNEQLQSVTASVMDLATAMDQDVGATSQAVGRMIQTGLAANAEEALDILTRGFQQGADRGGDLLDVVGEYGTTFSEIGLNGSASIGLLNQALAAGIPNADFAADALREMGIIAREGGEEAADALGDLGLNADKYFAAMQEGGPAAAGALDTVLDALRNTEDPALRASAATALVGTQYGDLGDAILQMDPSAATDGLGQIEGAAGRMGATLNDNASTNLTAFTRQLQGAFVDILGGQVIPFIEDTVAALTERFGPALDTVKAFITDDVVPALEDLKTKIDENRGAIEVVAAIITAVFLPHFLLMGAQAIATGAMVVIGWVMTTAGAIAAAAVHSAQVLLMIGRWVLLSGAALLNAGLTIGAWIGMGIAAVVNAGIVAAAWLGAQLRTVASLAVMALGFVVQGAVMAGAAMGTAIRVVAAWALMAAQSLIAAGRMAAAWLIAMGPVGWVIAAVVGLAILIIANWDKIKAATQRAWGYVSEKVSEAWRSVKEAVSSGIATAVEFVKGLPGKITGALSGFGSLLYDKGRDLIQGLVNGISSAASFVGDVAGSIVRSVRGFINSQVIDRLNSGLQFTIAGVSVNPPDIPRLHSGGVFTSSSGEGLALLRDDELVATPGQRRVADDLLRGLLAGDLPTARTAGQGAPSITIEEHVHAAPGESAATIAARVTQGVVWNLNAGITRPMTAGAAS